MEFKEFSTDENVALAKRVPKRMEKRSDGESSDTDRFLVRRKKKPAPDTTDDEFIKPIQKPKKIITTVTETDQTANMRTYKKFALYCNSLTVQQISDKNLHIIKERVNGM
ncbi:hypothetical protein K0M31_016693 [Melipona bicolor]|uniref:Uncharacterized protein n=1 Tax=Melipona bicolor TaxID=60889 RepID=A0AA40KEF1_9HYME|nr:hypothetical protein K0M31_016693 [Melipona bicolor]